jgi:hypothetical protein
MFYNIIKFQPLIYTTTIVKKMDASQEKLYNSLLPRAKAAGVNEERLRTAISEHGTDVGAIVKALGMSLKTPVTKCDEGDIKDKTEAFAGDRLYGENSIMPTGMRAFSTDPTAYGPTAQRSKPRDRQIDGSAFPPGSNLLKSAKDKRRELNSMVRSLQSNIAQQDGEVFTFPATTGNYNMSAAVEASISNYSKAKNRFTGRRSDGRHFSSGQNQLF